MEGPARDRHCDRIPDRDGALGGFSGRRRGAHHQQLIVMLGVRSWNVVQASQRFVRFLEATIARQTNGDFRGRYLRGQGT